MKRNLPVTQQEQVYADNSNILSRTDLKGRITYVNEDFEKISGFDSEELIGQSHNIVRHPDMPPAAFADLWQTVQSGESWMGVVKNRCKNGDHYWVDAFVTPVSRGGEVKEFQSVRSKPTPEVVARAEALYDRLADGKTPRSLNKRSWPLLWKISALSTLLPLLAAAIFLLTESPLIQGCLLLLLTVLAAAVGWKLLEPLDKVVKQSRKISDSRLARYVYTGRHDEAGQLQLALKMASSETAALIGSVADTSKVLDGNVASMSSSVEHSRNGAEQQFAETDTVASAVNEMSSSIQDVAANALQASDAAGDGREQVEQGKREVDLSVDEIGYLKTELDAAGKVIAAVEENSNSIATIVDVIQDIAEQTNLLALNAAIEAARAGDSGRGFAVVADEVRTLATRTRNSTEEINEMISRLQKASAKAVAAMEAGTERADKCLAQGTQAVDSLNRINQAIQIISDMNTQIAAAVEQQSTVAEEINRSVVSIRTMSEDSLEDVESSARASMEMGVMSSSLRELSGHFWEANINRH
ncbi:methyl-accepting chemotaxis protein [Marinobacterium jannaschii]|uniref:methyl-accepting chemotaxis protein n=1 Tax=Marinobacterium jannaschii TaxID=64970 RepID=UPI0004887A34|nr:PAS domain-containing methyl-accepting chemotaxis protein [Marinobacterium jannaschii]